MKYAAEDDDAAAPGCRGVARGGYLYEPLVCVADPCFDTDPWLWDPCPDFEPWPLEPCPDIELWPDA